MLDGSILIPISQAEFLAINAEFTNKRFDLGVEKHWYRTADKAVYAVVILDRVDDDWSVIIIGRDEHEAYRAFNVAVSLPTEQQAVRHAQVMVSACWHPKISVFPQGNSINN